jgi:hypothetical protein
MVTSFRFVPTTRKTPKANFRVVLNGCARDSACPARVSRAVQRKRETEAAVQAVYSNMTNWT